jgi:hypothetical protein
LDIDFTFTLSKPVDVPVTITFMLATNNDSNFVFGGNPGNDINELAGINRTVTIAAGDTTAEWSATTVPDAVSEDS